MGGLQLGPGDKMVEERKKLTTSSAFWGDGDGGEKGGGEGRLWGCGMRVGRRKRERKGEREGR